MRWMFAFGLVLICSVEARPQSMEGWVKIPELQLAFETDHRMCSERSEQAQVLDGRGSDPRIVAAAPPNVVWPVPKGAQMAAFERCMRARGWVRP